MSIFLKWGQSLLGTAGFYFSSIGDCLIIYPAIGATEGLERVTNVEHGMVILGWQVPGWAIMGDGSHYSFG